MIHCPLSYEKREASYDELRMAPLLCNQTAFYEKTKFKLKLGEATYSSPSGRDKMANST
jgi:hypothetical protein